MNVDVRISQKETETATEMVWTRLACAVALVKRMQIRMAFVTT